MDGTLAIRMSAAVAAVGVVVSALEDWRNRREFADTGMMSWPVAELEVFPTRFASFDPLNRLLYGYATLQALIWVRIIGGAALLLASLLLARPVPALSGLVLAALVLTLFRSAYGADGADQMYIVVLSGLTLAALFPEGDLGRAIALWFVAAQLMLSYVIAGVAKMFGSPWRDGSGIVGVVSTYGYGSLTVSRIFHKHRALTLLVSWATITFESTFLLSWFLPPGGLLVYLCLGAAFHLGISTVMGLNNFLFAFLSAYPVTWYCLTQSV